MKLFGSNQSNFVDDFSKRFEHGFMEIMRTRYCKTKVLANRVYNDYISDKDHVHMNATRWVSLAGFCLFLGSVGKCKIEETDRGWMLEYIDREAIEREKINQLRMKMEINEEEKKQQRIQEAVKEAKQNGTFLQRKEATSLVRHEVQTKISLKIQPKFELKNELMTSTKQRCTSSAANLLDSESENEKILQKDCDGCPPKNSLSKTVLSSDLFDDEEILSEPPKKKRVLFNMKF